MHKRNEYANFQVHKLYMDVLMVIIAFLVSSYIYLFIYETQLSSGYLWTLLINSVVYVLTMIWYRMYNVMTFCYTDRIVKRTLSSCFAAFLCNISVAYLIDITFATRTFIIVFSLLSFILLLTLRLVYRKMANSNIGVSITHVLFVGSKNDLDRYTNFISKTSMKITVSNHLEYDDPRLQSESDFETLITQERIDEVVILQTIDGSNPAPFDIQSLLNVCEEVGLTTKILLDGYKLDVSHQFVSSLGPIPILTYHSKSLDSIQIFSKTVLDIILSAFALIVLSPVMLFTAIAIKIEDPKGPVFFSQVRVGKNGKHFKMYKFRSMFKDAEERKKELMEQNKIAGGLMFKMDNDPRITKVGKFLRKTSIDELPQLFNVIIGDMSLVGTRPPTLDEVEKYERHHHRRISIIPGITGMWQASGRSEILDFEEVVRLDKSYIDNWSLWLDIKLIFKTVMVVFARKGAS